MTEEQQAPKEKVTYVKRPGRLAKAREALRRKSFRERDPIKIGVVMTAILVVVGFAVFYYKELPFLGGTTYTAHFGEAAGLQPEDEVRVAGVRVGEVTSIELDGPKVVVKFRVRGAWVGDKTMAAIRVKTLLGQKNLVLDPLGGKEMNPDIPIPQDRTVTPYDVNEAFGELATIVGEIDAQQLASSFDALSDTFSALTPDSVRSTLDGMARISRSISERDTEMRELLERMNTFSKTLADRTEQFDSLINNGGKLLAEINARREAIHRLLVSAQELGKQLGGLVSDNKAQLKPALEQLDRVTAVLKRNQDNLDESLRLSGPFYRLIGNAVGNGSWLDGYLCGLVPAKGGGCVPPKRGG